MEQPPSMDSDFDRSADLPEGWLLPSIDDVCVVNPGKPAKDSLPQDASITFVPMSAVDADSGTILRPDERPFGKAFGGSYTPFRENDVLIAKITPCMENGKAAIARGLLNGMGFGSTEFHVLRPAGGVSPEYCYHYVRQESFREDAKNHMSGNVGQQRVPPDFIKGAHIPLPPLAEQRRIVAKVEELLTRVNAGRERLRKVPAILKRFRQAVLAAACSGRLTADWREDHSVDPASVGLARSARLVDPIAIKRLVRRGSQGVPEMEIPDHPSTWVSLSVRELAQVRGL